MLNCFDYIAEHGHEQVVFCFDKESGLRAIIAIHDSTLGPCLGGTRLWQYDNQDAALLDALRLSEGMTYKSAVAGLPYGGGKAVILADGLEDDPQIRAARFEAYGRFVETLNGRFITGEDVGTKPDDMVWVHKHTDHVAGLPGASGDPSPVTAYGVFRGIQAMTQDVLHTDNLHNVSVAVQGLGKVGMSLAEQLIDAGAEITAADINDERCRLAAAMGVRIVAPGLIYDVDCDVFSPCALGATINQDTIPRLRCRVIAGAANNQLDNPDLDSRLLTAYGIVYAVDYVINAGGLINVVDEIAGYDADRAHHKAGEIYYTIQEMLKISYDENITTQTAATRMAQRRLTGAGEGAFA